MDAPATPFTAVPPHSIEAEKSVLGAVLENGGALSSAIEALAEDDFYVPAHREIFSAAE